MGFALGIFTFIRRNRDYGLFEVISGQPRITVSELLSLALNLIATVGNEVCGFVHSATLRSALASEGRLEFNTNLRLLTAAQGKHWYNPNGAVLNLVMATLTIMSYATSSLVFVLVFSSDGVNGTLVFFVQPFAIFFLSGVMLLQAVIALAGVRSAKDMTWSGSPFENTAVCLSHSRPFHVRDRCMHGALDRDSESGPRVPLQIQPSAWQVHPRVRKIIFLLWALVPAALIWYAILTAVNNLVVQDSEKQFSWSVLPNQNSQTIYVFPAI